jgi:hypothetical protein
MRSVHSPMAYALSIGNSRNEKGRDATLPLPGVHRLPAWQSEKRWQE